MYYGAGNVEGAFEDLPEEEVSERIKEASLFMVSLDKMNKMVVVKVEPEDSAADRGKHLARLTTIIDSFNRRLKTTKPELYPSAELAHIILEGKLPDETPSAQG